MDNKNCEHLYKDASDKRYCVDCGEKIKYTKSEKEAIKIENKMEELETTALYRFSNKMDFDYTEYMTEEELNEYAECYKKRNNRCMMCGEIANECICEKGLCNLNK